MPLSSVGERIGEGVWELGGKPRHRKGRHCGYREKDPPVLLQVSMERKRMYKVNHKLTSLEAGYRRGYLDACCQ